MKRILIVLVCLVAWAAQADDPSPFLSGEALAAEVARNCSEGCVVMNAQEVEMLTQSVNAMLAERSQRAYKQGALSCRNAV
jgi:hypothetical protein